MISFDRRRLPGTLGRITHDDLLAVRTVGLMVRLSVVHAFSALCENQHGGQFGGFEDPTDIFKLFPDAVQRIRQAVAGKKKIIQILANGAKHFVTTHFDPVFNKAIVFDSLGMRAT